MKEESIAHKTARTSFWAAIGKISTMGISFVVSLILARLLSPSDYGVIALLSVFFAISTSIAECGFTNALIRKKDCNQEDYSTAFYYNLGVSVLLYILLFVGAPYIASFFDEPILTQITRVSALSIIINAISITQRVQLTKQLDFKKQSNISILCSIISGVIGIVLAYQGAGVWALVISSLSSSILSNILLLFVVRWCPSLSFSSESFRYLWGFGSKMLLTGIISTLYANIYSIVIGRAYDSKSLGIFNRGQTTAQLVPDTLTSVFTSTTLPIMAQIRDDRERLLSVYRKMVVLVSTLCIPICCLLASLAKPFVLFFLTEKWIDSVVYLQIFSLSVMFGAANVVNLNLFQVEGRSDITLKLEVIKKTIGFILVFSLLSFGPMALAIGSSVFNIFAYALNLYYAHKVSGLSVFVQIYDLLPCFISASLSAFMVYLITFIDIPSYLHLIVGASSGVIMYFLLTKYVFKMEIYSQLLSLRQNA